MYNHFGVTEIINCVGYATRVGGSCPSQPILDAMREANRAFVEIDDLQAAASKVIAHHTGAEAGIVTCGASAGLTLAAAACMTGANVEWMDQLPVTTGLPRNEIIYPKSGPFDYEHPLRASGAKLIQIDYASASALKRIEKAIGPKTAAIGYAWYHVDEKPSIEKLAALAHRHKLPLIMDAAMSLPPAENLSRFIRCGAALVVYSGGKHLGGPQASGILCGRRNLIRSAWVQMVDMDVRAGTWSLHRWIQEGWIARPPRHGIGRSMKVGKEAIIGLMTALELYAKRDFKAEQKRWHSLAKALVTGLEFLNAKLFFPSPTGQSYPTVQITIPPGTQNKLREQTPRIILAEDEQYPGRAYIYPMCLQPEHPKQIIAALRKAQP